MTLQRKGQCSRKLSRRVSARMSDMFTGRAAALFDAFWGLRLANWRAVAVSVQLTTHHPHNYRPCFRRSVGKVGKIAQLQQAFRNLVADKDEGSALSWARLAKAVSPPHKQGRTEVAVRRRTQSAQKPWNAGTVTMRYVRTADDSLLLSLSIIKLAMPSEEARSSLEKYSEENGKGMLV